MPDALHAITGVTFLSLFPRMTQLPQHSQAVKRPGEFASSATDGVRA